MATLAHAWRSRRGFRWAAGIGVVLLALVVFVLVWFQPQKLLIDDRVSEPEPRAAASAGSSRAPVLARGRFGSLEHDTSGTVRVLDLGGGRRVVRLEDLDTSNGPALYVYASANPADGSEQAFDDEFVDLGKLKGNLGDQNYELPAGVDLGELSTIVIWCDRFDAAFGAADLVEV